MCHWCPYVSQEKVWSGVTQPKWVNIGLSRILHHWHTSGKYKMKMQMSIHKCRWKTLNFSPILAQNYKQFLSSLAHQFTSLLVHKDISQPQWGLMVHKWIAYCQFSSIRRTQSPSINVSRLVLQLSLPNPLKPRVKLRMKMWLEQRQQAMLQLHLSDQQFFCVLRCVLY